MRSGASRRGAPPRSFSPVFGGRGSQSAAEQTDGSGAAIPRRATAQERARATLQWWRAAATAAASGCDASPASADAAGRGGAWHRTTDLAVGRGLVGFGTAAGGTMEQAVLAPPNKAFKLTKLSPAPSLVLRARLGRRCRLVPAPTRIDAGTASQLNARVRRTRGCNGR